MEKARDEECIVPGKSLDLPTHICLFNSSGTDLKGGNLEVVFQFITKV